MGYQADDALQAINSEYKAAPQVPWVGVAVLALANYRSVLTCWWQGMAGAGGQCRVFPPSVFGIRGGFRDRLSGLTLQAGHKPRLFA